MFLRHGPMPVGRRMLEVSAERNEGTGRTLRAGVPAMQ